MPATGDDVVLDRASLARWVRSQTGLRDDQIEWNGEAATRITVAGNRIPSKALVDTAQSALALWLGSRSERFEVRPVSGLSDIIIAGAPVRLVAKPLHYDRPVHRMQVWVDLLGTTGVVRSVPVSFEVTAYVKAAVADRDVAIGSTVASVLTEREVDVTTLTAAPRSSSDILAQGASTLRLRRGLRAGDVVTAFDLEPVPAIQRGDWVTLRLVNGNVSMESRVEALQDAQVGQSVRVKLNGAERSVLARVTGTGLVEIAR
jgi:flagella basal body P-ring formation protein FlgA